MHAMLTLDDLRSCVQALDGSGAGSFEERSSTDPKKTGEVDLRGKSASQTDAYVADTQELIDLITATLKLDPFDERRPKVRACVPRPPCSLLLPHSQHLACGARTSLASLR